MATLRRPAALGANNYDIDNNSNEYYDGVETSAASWSDTISEATGVWNHMAGVSLLLLLWVLSLMLPKGLRKQFFGANPRRYWRRRYAASDYSTSVDTNNESILLEIEKRRLQDMSVSMGPTIPSSTLTPSSNTTHLAHFHLQEHELPPSISDPDMTSIYLRPMARSTTRRGSMMLKTTTPSLMGSMTSVTSPGHPAIPRLPSAKILQETMQRLQSRGIRLVAHGVASDSKRVWIKFSQDDESLSWQTEFPRKIPNQLGEVSLVMMRGALHRIALVNILYVDVGKKTNAWRKPENKNILDTVCFSLLTQNGSLDLQANSRLERDALVSCFSMVLDQVHTQDWRLLYAESPGTSAVQSTCTGSDLHQVKF
jgi:hypothetical protein